jgi:hypothetical protein
VTTIVSTSNSKAASNGTVKFAQSSLLLLIASFLFKRGVDAFRFDFIRWEPNPVGELWICLSIGTGLLLIPTAIAVLTTKRAATIISVGLATLAFSIFTAQALLLLVDRLSDQTYVLLNPYLKDSNPIFPLVISFVATMISILQLKTYQPS